PRRSWSTAGSPRPPRRPRSGAFVEAARSSLLLRSFGEFLLGAGRGLEHGEGRLRLSRLEVEEPPATAGAGRGDELLLVRQHALDGLEIEPPARDVGIGRELPGALPEGGSVARAPV